jgi:hypothetical protein
MLTAEKTIMSANEQLNELGLLDKFKNAIKPKPKPKTEQEIEKLSRKMAIDKNSMAWGTGKHDTALDMFADQLSRGKGAYNSKLVLVDMSTHADLLNMHTAYARISAKLTEKPDAVFADIFDSAPLDESVLKVVKLITSSKGSVVFAVHKDIIAMVDNPASTPEQKIIAALATVQPHNAIMWVNKDLSSVLTDPMEPEAIKTALTDNNGITGIKWHPLPGVLKKAQGEVAASKAQPGKDAADAHATAMTDLGRKKEKKEKEKELAALDSGSTASELSVLKDRMFTVMSQIEDFNMSNADHIPHLIDRLMRTDVLPGGENAENLAKLQDLQQSLPNSTFKTNLGTYLTSR